MVNQLKYFAEHVEYDPEKEKEEAEQYLKSWKKFFLRKLQKPCYGINIIDEQWIHRDPYITGALAQKATMALKIAIEADFYYDLEKQLK